MKIGDNVRFLDSTGGGRITGFQGRDTVLVEDEYGFDIPVLMHNCVVVDTEKEKRIKGEAPTVAPKAVAKEAEVPEPEPADKPITYKPLNQERKGGDKLNLYLCFEPADRLQSSPSPNSPATLSKGKFDVYFVNDSNYYISYTLLSGESTIWMLRHIDTAEPNTKVYVETIETETLNEMQHICLQALAFKQDKTFMLKTPVSAELRLDLTRFYKPHLFRPNDFFSTPVLTVTVAENDIATCNLHKMLTGKTDIKLTGNTIKNTGKKTEGNAKPADTKQDEVIDLHADELLDTTTGMSPADILEYQVDTFRKKMDECIKIKGKHIVFIHGKGDGILRNKIVQELKRKYPRCNWQDASFREYGFGATLVIVH